jgi:type III secretion protein L
MDMDQSNMEQHADARFAVSHTGPGGIQVNRASQIMSAQAHASFLNAGEMLARAQQLADETIATAEDGYRKACEEGYQAGLEQARQQNTRENIDIGLRRHRSLGALEQDVSALLMQTLRQMLGEIDCAERIRMLVREALARLGKLQGEIAVHVHPEQTAQIASSLLQLNAIHPEATLQAIADPAIDTDACRVVSSSGCIEGNLLQQLAAIESALCAHSDKRATDEMQAC